MSAGVQETLEGLQQAATTAGQAPKGGAGVQANDREGPRGVQSVDRYMRLLRVVCCVSSVACRLLRVVRQLSRCLQVEKLMKKMQTMPEYASVGQACGTTQYPTAPYSTREYPMLWTREQRGLRLRLEREILRLLGSWMGTV
jgi:hypothetical protein